MRRIGRHDITQERAEHTRIANATHAGKKHISRVTTEIGHDQCTQQLPTVGVRISTHAPCTLGRKFGQFWLQATTVIEQLLGAIAL